MELSIYDIIKKRILTTKSLDTYKKLGHVVFEVHTDANKIMIKQAVEKIWNVKVDSVRVLTIPGKTKSFGRRKFKTTNRKKAIISLKEGYKIDLPSHFETIGKDKVESKKSKKDESSDTEKSKNSSKNVAVEGK